MKYSAIRRVTSPRAVTYWATRTSDGRTVRISKAVYEDYPICRWHKANCLVTTRKGDTVTDHMSF